MLENFTSGAATTVAIDSGEWRSAGRRAGPIAAEPTANPGSDRLQSGE